MIVHIRNTPRGYDWGSRTAIPALMGSEPTGQPQAELWLGTHPGSPSIAVRADGSELPLLSWFAEAGLTGSLPYLFKILAAAHPLSLQVHPSRAQAARGFHREEELQIPVDAPNRNYRDREHKPEIIIALSDTFDALCGFRPLEQVQFDLSAAATLLGEAEGVSITDAAARLGNQEEPKPSETWAQQARSEFIEWLFSSGEESETLMQALDRALAADAGLTERSPNLSTFVSLRNAYPGDPGAAVSLLLNRVTLVAGESLYLPAGNIHAYLEGLGVEVMAASDNVLRGGLTSKHVDTRELVSILDFATLDAPRMEAVGVSPGISKWVPGVEDFSVWKVVAYLDSPRIVDLCGPVVGFVTDGEMTIADKNGSIRCARGESFAGFWGGAGESGPVSFDGNGTVFVATVGVSPEKIPVS